MKRANKPAQRRSRQTPLRNLDEQLTQLEQAQLVRALAEDEPIYIFKHTLTQATAYASLLKNQRREIHRRVAQAYQELYAERCLDEFAAVLAEHYRQAGDDEQALRYSTRAGDVAARIYANTEAIAFYTQALAIARQRANNTTQLIYLYTRRGRASELAENYPRAIENYQEMQTLAQARGDRALELEASMLQATAYAVGLGKRDWQKAQALSTEALTLARELGNRQAEARIYWNLLLINRFSNEGPRRAIEYGEKSLALARELNLKEQIALTLKDLAIVYVTLGQTRAARNNLPETLALWRELDNKPMLAEVLGGASSYHLIAGELEQAAQAGEESLALNQSINNRYGLAVTASFLWYVYRERGEMQKALELIAQALAIADELGFVGPQWGARVELADTFVSLGAFARAEEYARRALEAADLVPLARPRIYPRAVFARVQLQMGKPVAAAEWLAPFSPQTLTVESGVNASPPAVFTIHSAYVELALAQGDAARALALTDDLIAFLERIEFVLFLPSAFQLKGKALWMLHRADEAHVWLSEARRRAEAMRLRYRLLPILFTLIETETERGNAAAANTTRAHAREMIEYLATHTPPDLRGSFLKLPDVRAVLTAA